MKKISKIVSALVVAAALTVSATAVAFGDVVFKEKDLTVTGAGEYTATDLFDNFKNVMPGDQLTQPVRIVNNSDMDIDVYIRAIPHDEAGNPLTYSEPFEAADGKDQGKDPEKGDLIGGEGERDETVATMQDFLAQLSMTIVAEGVTIFNDQPQVASTLAENYYLGELPAGETLQLDVTLNVPITMGNEYANRVGEVDWVFAVEEIPEDGLDDPNKPWPGDGPEDGQGGHGGYGVQTGDNLPVVLIAGVAGIAALVAVIALVAMRRSRRSE